VGLLEYYLVDRVQRHLVEFLEDSLLIHNARQCHL